MSDLYAAQARQRAIAAGLAGDLDGVTNAVSRCDALYREADASGYPWVSARGCMGVLADGRVVLACPDVWFAEPKRGGDGGGRGDLTWANLDPSAMEKS